ncbi:RHS repeat domain-containing protein [Sinomicrobium weinanense]|uniref:RHS repeat protein n=1 Tax=Sinomicrobium weinanense TaxID=2842200 RepID=A0A926JRB4_9FLAO|nr:RHS repeat domain-containing protein [Sinomicrobium weinanense]MBC9795858.1 RHS repeat protein [Sinomicrobium weinanense]MBU3125378.1 RHS repeat protein [Sinomicrobium weinanense]
MKKLLLILVVFIPNYLALAQSSSEITSLNPTLQNYLPPSPEVSAMMKFGDIPVGEATGIPDISIPVYSYNHPSNGLKLDVSLSYHAGGIKLNEPSSSVGIGWALTAGGVVSRMVRGIYDEKPNVGFIYQDELPDEIDGNSPGTVSLRPYNNMYGNVLDNQSDIFSYSFGGKSGKFMLGKNNDILVLNRSKIRIEKTIGTVTIYGSNVQLIKSFTITDEDGMKYVFSAYESTVNLGDGVSNKYTSSWYLTKIISPKASASATSINFEYESDGINNYNTSQYKSTHRRIDGTGNEIMSGGTASQNLITRFLKKITFPNGVIMTFDYETNGVDNAIGRHLKKITVTDGENTQGFLLEQDYSLNRSTLKKVTSFGGSETNTDTPYTFEYTGSLPDRYSSIPDHWGYYRGSGGSWIPREIVRGGFGKGIYELSGGDRDTDPDHVKKGVLRKMTYPTGGYTIFDMEANEAEDNWLDQDFTVTVPGPAYRNKSASAYVSSDAPYKSIIADIPFEGENNTITTMEMTVSSGTALECHGDCKIVAEIYKSSDLSIANLVSVQEVPYNSYGSSKSFSLSNLIKGNNYKAVLYTTGLTDYSTYVMINWREQMPGDTHQETYRHKQPYVGGLRVKKITDYDGVHSTPAKTRTYEYVMEDGETSSGTLGVYPQYSYAAFYDNLSNPNNGAYTPPITPPEIYLWTESNVIVRTSSPLFDLSTINGSPVVYKRVVIKTVADGISQGKEAKYFTSFADFRPVRTTSFPFVPIQVDAWNYGLLKKHLIYDKQGNLLKKTVNTYGYSQGSYFQDPIRRENFRSITISPVKFFTGAYEPRSSETPPLGMPIYFLSRSFNPKTSRVDLKQTIDSTFSGGTPVVVEKNYTYTPNYFSLKTQNTITSEGKILNRYFTYAYDELGTTNDPGGAHQKLIDNNEIHTVTRETTKIKETTNANEVPLVSLRTKYKIQGNQVFPDEILTSKGTAPLSPHVQYHKYDSYGNPEEVSLVSGPHIVYLWGYNGQQLIAKIENVTSYSSIPSGLVTAAKNASNTGTETSLIAALNDIRKALPKSHVTTYTYKPLVGITTITDPMGEETTYTYDDFNRLEFIKDETNKLLEEYKYHYKN